MINIYRGKKQPVSLDRIDPFHRMLLENRMLTTALLEELTGSAVAVDPCTRVRGRCAVRFAVLTGGGRVFVFARSTVNLALLPEPAVVELLKGQVPLGRIFARHAGDHQRRNFSYFTIEDERLTPIMYGRLPGSVQDRGRSSRKRRVRSFPGRAYDILLGPARLARIEEIFSHQIRERALEWWGATENRRRLSA